VTAVGGCRTGRRGVPQDGVDRAREKEMTDLDGRSRPSRAHNAKPYLVRGLFPHAAPAKIFLPPRTHSRTHALTHSQPSSGDVQSSWGRARRGHSPISFLFSSSLYFLPFLAARPFLSSFFLSPVHGRESARDKQREARK
jgi:hypothetical protein